jgi:hypothetical protein
MIKMDKPNLSEKIAEMYYNFFGCSTYQILDQQSFVDAVVDTETLRQKLGLKMTNQEVIVSFQKRMKKLCKEGKAVDLLSLHLPKNNSSVSN